VVSYLHTVVTICTTCCNIKKYLFFVQRVFLCFVYSYFPTVSLNSINWLAFFFLATFCEVGTECFKYYVDKWLLASSPAFGYANPTALPNKSTAHTHALSSVLECRDCWLKSASMRQDPAVCGLPRLWRKYWAGHLWDRKWIYTCMYIV
jgi:hypothetical protein